MNFSNTRNRWIASIALSVAIAITAVVSSGEWSDSALATTAGPAPMAEIQKVVASDGAANANYGYAIAIDGDTMVVGAASDVHAGTSSGSAYVYLRTGATWAQQQKLTASDAADGDQFGISVGISGDTIIIGAYKDDHSSKIAAGSAYIFVRSGTTWTQQAKLIAPTVLADTYFALAVDIDGDTAVVGAGKVDTPVGDAGNVYVYVRSGTTWTHQQQIAASDAADSNWFGYSVAIDGESILVGAAGANVGSNNNQGAAYVFTRSGTTWTQQQKLVASDGS